MFNRKWSLCALLALAVTALAAPALARPNATDPNGSVDPNAVARRAVARMTGIANRVVAANAADANAAVERIERLIEAGHIRAAFHVARDAARRINRRSNTACGEIRHVGRHALRLLRRLGADELMREVGQACRRQCRRVRLAQREALQAIHEALPSREQ